MIEIYVDADPAQWRDDPCAVAHIGALKLQPEKSKARLRGL